MRDEDVVVVPYRDGPYLVRGPMVLRDQEGRTIELTRRTVALCRCGRSQIRPFCDGTHRTIRFRAPSRLENPHGDLPDDDQLGSPPKPARRRQSAATQRLMSLNLIRGALAALEPLAGTTEAASEAIAQLTEAVALLQPDEDGSWPSRA